MFENKYQHLGPTYGEKITMIDSLLAVGLSQKKRKKILYVVDGSDALGQDINYNLVIHIKNLTFCQIDEIYKIICSV